MPWRKLIIAERPPAGAKRIPGPSANGKKLPRLLDEPDLIAAIRRDIAALGLVGEEGTCLLVYLAYSSRVQDDPTALIARGPSSSGKSALLKKVACLFPPEVKIEAMEMTPAAWFNTEPDF